jgi:predicted PurR-regulated permease PerM
MRMFFMKKYADVHPLITIFGIVLGMNLFGFWGIIFGPLVISGFLVLLKIYKNEFLEN